MALDPQYTDAIRGFEGYSAQPQWDYKQNSSGYGTKALPGDENIPPDQLRNVHEQRFNSAIEQAAAHVDSINPNLPPGVRAALVSLTYNAGPGWAKSGLGEAVRAGDLEKAQGIFPQYNKADGEVNPGLVARREKELAWWGGQPQPAQASPAAPPSTPLQLAPRAPIFPQAPPQAQPQQQQAPQQAEAFQMQPPGQPPPIFFAPRRSPDLSKLRAALGRPSFFGRG